MKDWWNKNKVTIISYISSIVLYAILFWLMVYEFPWLGKGALFTFSLFAIWIIAQIIREQIDKEENNDDEFLDD